MIHRAAALGVVAAILTSGAGFSEVRRLGAEQAVSTSQVRQKNPAVAARADGSAWVVWENLEQGLVARRISRGGVALGEEVVLAANRNLDHIPAHGIVTWHHEPAIAALGGGGFAVAWVRERIDLQLDHFWEHRELVDRYVVFQVFDANARPLGKALLVDSSNPAPQGFPQLALGDGWAGIVWQQATSGDGRADQGELRGRFIDLAGAFASGAFRIAGAQSIHASVAVDATQALWVSWQAPDGSGDGVFVRRFRSNGRALGSAIRANATLEGCQRRPALAARADGGYWVFFHGPASDPEDNVVFARRLNADATPAGAEIAVSPGVHDDEVYPAVAPLGGGRYLLMWMAWWKNMPQGFFGRELQDDGTLAAIGEPVALNEFRAYTQFRTALSSASGRAVAAWESLAPKQKKAGVSVQSIGLDD
jgi:hypothetical protein